MVRIIVLIAVILGLLAFAGYRYFSGREYEIRIPESEIQAKLSEKLPRTKTYLGLFQLTLKNPRVQLLEDSGRIRAGLDLQLTIKLGGSREPLSGSVDASGLLRYAPEQGQFFLAEPQIEQLQIQGLPDKHSGKARAVITAALTEYFASHPVYRLKKDDARQAAARLVLKNVAVSGDELVVTMGL
ncbi:DUF1439 domain-containing protein [Microbulbifer hainanensis]|uniref:DUF1439 domain-containing protein n=1 Tax=Microbulbifer hainanensis TaxID=2735675 RepID=UPI0018662055|nr:DUF1439 domain-containing protein [Microbulbifer hainanensis]